MDDGVNGSNISPSKPKETYKAGWLKKSGGLLGLWKDRYIEILKTQLLVCENEDDQKCLDTLELANYERCQDQKAFLKRKRHFTLIPSPGTKVQDVKFQARNAEERDTWIQALNDGINRGKNKALDEVKVDTSCSLEHVTRDRPKVGATKRRPPTRIHLKEVAEAATDDSLRLGLEALDTGVLTVVPPMPKLKETESTPQKEPVKTPMPPTKEPENIHMPPTKESEKILMPPTKEPSKILMPPVKEPAKILMPPTKSNNPQTVETTIPDITDSDVQAPQAPCPPPKNLKENVYAHEKRLSENEQTGMKENSALGTEILNEVASSPPKPPPKILSDKIKIKWVGSSSDLDDKEDTMSDERGSKENLVDFESDELETPSGSHKAEFLEDLQTKELRSSLNSLQEESSRLSQHVNEVDLDEGDLQATSAESIHKSNEMERNESLTCDVQELHTKQPTDEKKVRYIKHKMKTGHVTAKTHHMKSKMKASSMGDLLSPTNETDKDSTMLHLTKDHLDQVEMKLACGKERTKTLLNQILMGQLGKTAEGNGVECNPETILNDLMAQLQEASEVLQEIKEKEPKNTLNTSDVVTETQKEKQRKLMALQRRSVPF